MVTEHWTLPDDLTAAGAAREHVAATLAGRANIDDAVLVASELAANAARHGLPPIDLRIQIADDRTRITVGNRVLEAGTAAEPRVTDAHPDAHHGRGLAIIESLAEDLGWDRVGDRLEVWAELRVPDVS